MDKSTTEIDMATPDRTDQQIAAAPQELREKLPHQTLRVLFKTVTTLNIIYKESGAVAMEDYMKKMTQIQKDAIADLMKAIPPQAGEQRAVELMEYFGIKIR